MKTIGIHQPQYLPWLGLIKRIKSCDEFVLLDNVAYGKNYFYNRNRIKTANGWIWLTIPVINKNRFGQLIKETENNNAFNWRENHRKSIYFSYKKSPYFEKYWKDFEEIYNKEWSLLSEIAEAIMKLILEAFGIITPIYKASELGVSGKKEELILNICKKLQADKYLSGPDGRNYLNLEKWKNQNIEVEFQDFKHPIYPQMYGEFIPQMAAIDLLFNCGPKSLSFLEREEGQNTVLVLK